MNTKMSKAVLLNSVDSTSNTMARLRMTKEATQTVLN